MTNIIARNTKLFQLFMLLFVIRLLINGTELLRYGSPYFLKDNEVDIVFLDLFCHGIPTIMILLVLLVFVIKDFHQTAQVPDDQPRSSLFCEPIHFLNQVAVATDPIVVMVSACS